MSNAITEYILEYELYENLNNYEKYVINKFLMSNLPYYEQPINNNEIIINKLINAILEYSVNIEISKSEKNYLNTLLKKLDEKLND